MAGKIELETENEIRQQLEARQELLRKRLEVREEVSTVFGLDDKQTEHEEQADQPNQRVASIQEFFSQKKAALNKVDSLSNQIAKTYHEFLECEAGMVANLKEATAVREEIETAQTNQQAGPNGNDGNNGNNGTDKTLNRLVTREVELAEQYTELSARWEAIFEKLGKLLEQKEANAPASTVTTAKDRNNKRGRKAASGSIASQEETEAAENNALMETLSSAFYYATREALALNTFERKDGSPWPTATLNKGGASGHAQLMPPIVENQPLMPPEEVERWVQMMWKQREELSDLDADALDLLCHVWLKQVTKPEDSAVGDIDELLEMRGLQKKQSGAGRRGGYTHEQRLEMLRALSHIQSIWLNLGQVEVYEEAEAEGEEATETAESNGNSDNVKANGKNGAGKSKGRRRQAVKKAMQSRAFIVTDRLGQLQLNGYMEVERFIFQPGKLFAHFLYGPGRQTAMLSAKAIHYDRYRQKWEKRLARYFSWQWRIQSGRGDYSRPYRVDTLLKAVGEEIDPRRPADTRNRLEKALDRLQEDGVIASWQYDRWLEKTAEQRGWAAIWVTATIILEPPESIQEAYKTLEQPSRSPEEHKTIAHSLNEPSNVSLGDRIKRRRHELSLSQSQAAEELDIAQSYFSKLEKNRVSPSPELLRRLQKWLSDLT